MDWKLIEDFLEYATGKENEKGEVLFTSSEILNLLKKSEHENLTFKGFNKMLAGAYLGRSTKNRYRYSIELLKRAFETKCIPAKIDVIKKQRFSSQSGFLLANYYGNKHYWVEEYRLLFEILSKECDCLYDSFCGSAILSLLATDYFNQVYMNDRNSHLVNFHRCMAGKEREYQRLAAQIVTTGNITKEKFKEMSVDFKTDKYYRYSDYNMAGNFFIYQEHSWNGTGGYKKNIRDLKKLTPYLNYTRPYYKKINDIYNYSFVKFLTPVINANDPQAVLLCDPPYRLSLRYYEHKQYRHEFTEENHRQLLRLLRNASAKVILCCYVDMNNLEEDLYCRYLLQSKQVKGKWHLLKFLRHSKHGKTEFIFVNFNVDDLIKTEFFVEITET